MSEFIRVLKFTLFSISAGVIQMDSFYALANRARRGINNSYEVVIKKGGETDYPVLGKNDPIHKYGDAVLSPVTYCESQKQ